MTRQAKGWTSIAGAVVTALTILGFGWRIAEGWFALVGRVSALEQQQQYLHGSIELPQKGR